MKRTVLMALALAILMVGCAQHRVGSEISIEEPGFFPEGVTAGPDGELYIGSVTQGTIVRVGPTSNQSETFIQGHDGLLSITGIAADPVRDVLWVCSVDLGFSGVTGTAAPSVQAYALSSGKQLKTYPLEKGAFPNHVVLGKDGAAYITDSFKPVIYRTSIQGNNIEKWLVDPQFSVLPPNPTNLVHRINLNGSAFGKDGNLYAVKTNTGELYRIGLNKDGTSGPVSVVNLPRPLDRPDGLETLADGSMLVVEAGERVVRLTPEGDSFSMKTLKDHLDFPTTTITQGKTVWVVESQFQYLGSPENAKPFKLIRIDLE